MSCKSEEQAYESRCKLKTVNEALVESQPIRNALQELKPLLEDDVDKNIDLLSDSVYHFSKGTMGDFISNFDTYTTGVYFPGVWRLYRYGQDCCALLRRVALIRLRKCDEYSLKKASDYLDQIEPKMLQFEEMQSNRSASEEKVVLNALPPQIDSYFTARDFIVLTEAFLPAVGLISLGYLGLTLSDFSFNPSGILFKVFVKGKSFFGVAALAGIGLMINSLSDFNKNLRRVVLQNIQRHIQNADYVESVADKAYKSVKRSVRGRVWQLQSIYQRKVEDVSKVHNQQRLLETELRKTVESYEAIETQAKLLLNAVQAIRLDDVLTDEANGVDSDPSGR
jgi:hypothetical protein